MASTAIDLLAPVHRLSVKRYVQMGEAGVFDDAGRVELIDGVIVEMSPVGWPHTRAVAWLNKVLVPQLDPAHILIPQSAAPMPEQGSAPEPDIWIIEETQVGVDDPLPLLIIEVSVASLSYDRVTKARLYALRGIADYWIVNVTDAAVEVHREPARESWGERSTHGPGDVLEPLELPGVTVDVAALLAFVAG